MQPDLMSTCLTKPGSDRAICFVVAAMHGRNLKRPQGSNLPHRSWWSAVYGNDDIFCGNSGFPDDDCTSDESEEDHCPGIEFFATFPFKVMTLI